MRIKEHPETESAAAVVNAPQAWPCVAISILNWNGWGDTLECLDSVRRLTYPNYLTIVVDNASRDDSVERIQAWAADCLGKDGLLVEYSSAEALAGGDPEKETALEALPSQSRLILIRNEDNLGFAGGNNVAIHYALTKHCPAHYVFLLNNDATVEKDCLSQLVLVDRRADAGIVGATILDQDGKNVRFGGQAPFSRQFFSPLIRWQLPPPPHHDGFWPSFFVSASGVLVRRDVLAAVRCFTGEYLDSRLFMYEEELAFSFVAHKAGYKSVVAKDALVYHKKANSSGGAYNPIVYYYPDRNRIHLANKLLPLPQKLLFHLFNVPICLARAAKNVACGRRASAKAILCALADGYRGVGGKWKHHDREAL